MAEMNKEDYQPPIPPKLPGHMKESDMTDLLEFAATLAREGKWREARLLCRAFDDLRGAPLPPKGMHTN